MNLDLDINSDIYPLEERERFTLTLASTLNESGGAADSGHYDQSGAPSLLDKYEYAMYGKLYKWKQDNPKAPIEVQVSYGGLLMRLRGDPKMLQKLALDMRVYLLIRKLKVA